MSVAEAVDAYLAEVEAAMHGSFWEKQAVRSELRAHLAALAREYELAGQSSADAMRQSMRDLGHPTDVGLALRSSRGRDAIRVGRLPRGNITFERSIRRPMPPTILIIALGAIGISSVALLVMFTWP